jgi:hypothetical protein
MDRRLTVRGAPGWRFGDGAPRTLVAGRPLHRRSIIGMTPPRFLLLALLLLASAVPAGAAESAPGGEPAPGANGSSDPKVRRIEERIATNAKQLQTQRERRDKVMAAVTDAQDNLAALAAQLLRIEQLSAKAQAESAASGNDTASPATLAELDAANAEVAPLQRKKRGWTRTAEEGRRLLATLRTGIASLEVDRERLLRELEKARSP